MSYGQYSNEPKVMKPAMPKKTGKREKHVFGPRDTGVEHVWANPGTGDNKGTGFTQTYGDNARHNLFFRTDTDGTRVMFSYRDSYPIASRFMIGKGKRQHAVYLVRSGKGYSVTTAGHMHVARCAVPDKANMFMVPDVIRPNGYTHEYRPDNATHLVNLADYVSRIQSEIDKHVKARATWVIKMAHNDALALRDEAKRYARVFGVKCPKLPIVPKIDAKKLESITERERCTAIRKEAKRKADGEARDAQRAAEVKAWQDSGYCKHTPAHSLYEKHYCESQTEQEDWDAHKVERIAAWKRGEDVTLRGAYNEPALLRVQMARIDGIITAIVETSQHVTVPVSGKLGAARLLRFLRVCKESGRTYERNGHSEHIGQFVVDSFQPLIGRPSAVEWVLVAGCHRILWSEIESIAQQVSDAEQKETPYKSGEVEYNTLGERIPGFRD